MLRIGDRLRNARIRQRLSLEDVSHATKIRASFLSAIEDGQYEKLPSPTYVEGFVGNYAQYLGLPKSQMIALFRREFDAKKSYAVLPESFARKKEFKIKRINTGQLFFLAIGILAVIGYLVFQYRFAFTNPALDIAAPKENAVIQADVIQVSGKTNADSSVWVNDAPVQVNEDGSFSKKLSVFPGDVVIVIKAQNRIGRETIVTRNVIIKE